MDLGLITTKQKMVGVGFVAHDTNENQVPSTNNLQLTALPAGIVTFANLVEVSGDSPAHSAYTVDIIGVGVGSATITAQGQQVAFGANFSSTDTIEVTLDPSTPGLPTHWVATPGVILPQ